MDHLLSLSQAARIVGVRRATLQKQIQDGKLLTFEGHIRLSELLKEYPQARREDSGMLEKVDRIQAGALYKLPADARPDRETLAAEVHRLRLELGATRQELEGYRRLAGELKERLYDIVDQCDRRQGALLSALIAWYARKLNQRR